jgi:hypothetical protein
MKRWVHDVNWPEEYQKLRKTVHRIHILRESEQILPRKNYWAAYPLNVKKDFLKTKKSFILGRQ